LKKDQDNSIFIVDSCLGGISVVKSLWRSNQARQCLFLADYEVNPLGKKTPAFIATVVDRWINIAKKHSDTLILACNTLSIKYEQLNREKKDIRGLIQIISMVDCFYNMTEMESSRLEGSKVLIVGTEFTASQPLYSDILASRHPGADVATIAATELERRIARISSLEECISDDVTMAIKKADVVILACTCFPIIQDYLESLFSGVVFLNPGNYCPKLISSQNDNNEKDLKLIVTGNVVSASKVINFSKEYIDDGFVSQY
jgi:glutamate racemase